MGHILRDHIKQTEPFEDAAQEAMLNLFVAAAEVRRRVEQVCEQHDLQFSHHNVLRILRGVHPEGHPRCEIIERMLDPSPDVTRLIDKLVDRGVVRRTTSDEDRRMTIHTITADGLDLLERMGPEIREVQRWFDERVADRDLQHLSRICEGIYTGFQDDG
ncbi:MarR family winged helix-turn-helix transcriptional regulator [Salinibacter ruber]|uniref:DNA-binding MarR family transcriptional regulator n=2 Tax=Salinibacter ruber TaxID=146919 RepID=A0A9X2UI91_9BACT|nr:MarR family transcriptional regulator [Salinibacter ruber]MCS3613976.1 DNA-binding MarR family transcriptional regulator [Salinibacter ruber]MCS3674250.1 DNA-binding MarR family transcriptional regulator [Salinibacter ruber]MCS3783386.1 DNA-binding MarR family transcriptional regulator [Salinibacter ruber]MCS4035003.1 DNA-binding MarR family transcriptional regulator [Salinibacter ruber]MCS4137698.1 DNA-binding MarR family transcriptional regulator [Salinibacter ruber]